MNDLSVISTQDVERLARSLEAVFDAYPAARSGASGLDGLAAHLSGSEHVTLGATLRLSLLNDALCAAERALGQRQALDSADQLEPLVRETREYLARLRPAYRERATGSGLALRELLAQHTADAGAFGARCESTAWLGLSFCRRAAELTGDVHYVDEYQQLLTRVLDGLCSDALPCGAAPSGDVAEGEGRRAVVGELLQRARIARPARDPRDVAYCSPTSADVFQPAQHGADVFVPDPFDVEQIHAEARAAFGRLCRRAEEAQFGSLLLVEGPAGSGKTHLLRAFRSQVHRQQLGFAAYVELSTRLPSYSRYLLASLIDSWDRPYYGDVIAEPAISCLADSLARQLSPVTLARLRDEALPDAAVASVVHDAAEELSRAERFRGARLDVVRALLHLDRRDPARRPLALEYLRCEPLTAADAELLGALAPQDDEQAPAAMLAELGRLVLASGNGALVVLVDQLEDHHHPGGAPARLREALAALRQLMDHVPSSVVVIACDDELYAEARALLPPALRDRVEQDPEPVQLTAQRTLPEIEALIAPRLAQLFERQQVLVRQEEPLFPFAPADLEALVHQRTRDVLDWCRAHHEASIRAGGLVIFAPRPGLEPPAASDGALELEQAYNDHVGSARAAPRAPAGKVSLIAWALEHVWRELPGLPRVQAHVDGTYVQARFGERQLGLALCERGPAGGALAKQIDALRRLAAAGGATPILLRSAEYPRAAGDVADELKRLLADGGRRVLITDTEWRRMLALKLFLASRADSPEVDAWLERERPLSGLSALREILELDLRARRAGRGAQRSAPPRRSSVPPSLRPSLPPPPVVYRVQRAPVAAGAGFGIGQTRELEPQQVLLHPGRLAAHAAFVGGRGSGHVALALSVVERLLELGVPVAVVGDGELATHARLALGGGPPGAGELGERAAALAELADVRVFTPGEPRGRPLRVPLVPGGLAGLPAHERGLAAQQAAAALGALMGYGPSGRERDRLAALGKAIERCAERGDGASGLTAIASLLESEDAELVASLGRLDRAGLGALVENLRTLGLRRGELLGAGETLTPELLFGLGSQREPGRARLSIVSTRFLGDAAASEFWVARLLGELERFARHRSAGALEAALVLGGAERHLPAGARSWAKEALTRLLGRAGNAGLGLLLVSDEPAELDYGAADNIQSWFLGRIEPSASAGALRPLLSHCRLHLAPKLAHARSGELFRLEAGEITAFKARAPACSPAPLADAELLRAAAGV